MRTGIINLLALLVISIVAGCGGGGSDGGVLLYGTLIEGGEVEHRAGIALRHGTNEPIAGVKICSAESCSTTDEAGQWGMTLGASTAGSPIELTVSGHGISTALTVTIPHGALDVFAHLLHVGESIHVHHLTVERSTHHEDSDRAEDQHSESEQSHD